MPIDLLLFLKERTRNGASYASSEVRA